MIVKFKKRYTKEPIIEVEISNEYATKTRAEQHVAAIIAAVAEKKDFIHEHLLSLVTIADDALYSGNWWITPR